MNILTDEEISLMAHNTDDAEWNDISYRDCWHDGFKAAARAVEAAVLKKLVERVGEPVAWRYKYRFKDIGETRAYEYHSHDFAVVARFPKGDPLYTESQLIAAQQKAAEACAKVCEIVDEEYEGEDVLGTWCSEAIRNGEWREYL